IMILPKDAPVGKPFAEFMGFDDVTFEINVTPNRADCLSHIGIAREIATLFDRELKMPEAKNKPGKKTLKDKVKVEVQDSGENCPRYALRGVLGVKVGPSPQWLKARLEAVGLNSINNVVDVTNYVMFESGQPLHAFDAGTIRGGKILIGPA